MGERAEVEPKKKSKPEEAFRFARDSDKTLIDVRLLSRPINPPKSTSRPPSPRLLARHRP